MKNKLEKHSKLFKKLELPPPSKEETNLWMSFFNAIENYIKSNKFWIKGQTLMDDLNVDPKTTKKFIEYAEKHKLLKISFQGICPNCGNFLLEINQDDLKSKEILKECNECLKLVEIEKDSNSIETILNFNISSFDYLFQNEHLTTEELERKNKLYELFLNSQEQRITKYEKGKRFEIFSKEILKLINDFEFKAQNQLTETSEIDLIFFNKSPKFGFNQDYFIVQSKNQKKTTDVLAVCHLVSDMLIREIKLGFIISSSNISKNAYKRIIEHFIKNNIIIIVIDKGYIEKLFENMNLEKIIEILYYDLRFKRI